MGKKIGSVLFKNLPPEWQEFWGSAVITAAVILTGVIMILLSR